METEYKFSLKDTAVFDRIVESAEINKMGIDAVETIEMHASYFDTPEQNFRKAGIAYRIRQEDDRITATIKWDVNVSDGLHRREEFNLVVNDERFAENPDIGLFISSDAYDVLYSAAGDKKLVETISMDYTRRQFTVDTGQSISCISVDEGLEIEWYYGDEEDFIALANFIRDKYGLETEDRSKLQRATA